MAVSTINIGVARPTDTSTTTTSTPVKRRDGAWVAPPPADDVEDFADSFKLLINMSRALGAVPVHKTEAGWKVSVASPVFVYAVIVYLCLFVLFAHVIDLLLDINASFFGSRSAFHQKVYNHMFIGLLTLYLVVPVSSWMDAPHLAEYINEWNAFQELFKSTVGRRLHIKNTRRTQAAVCMGSAVFIGTCLHLFGLREMRTWELAPHFVSLFYGAICGCYWMLTSNAIVGAAAQLNAEFLMALRASEAPQRELYAYRRLWLSLSRLTGTTSSSFCRTSGIFTLTSLYLIVMAVHGLFSSIVGLHSTFNSNVVYIMTSGTTVLSFYIYCNRGYRITEEVKNGILYSLQDINTPECDCKTVHEVNLFFQCIESNPPVLSLGGFVTVNRDLFKSCCATILTYLVVVIQFELGLDLSDGEETPSRNATGVQ